MIRSSLGILFYGRCIFTRPFCPIPGTLGAGITDGGEEIVSVMVSCDVGTRSESGSEDERVKLCISSPDLFRLGLFFGGRRVSDESEKTNLCVDV